MLNTGRIFCLVLLIAGCYALPANTNAQTKKDSSNNNNRTTELFAYPAEQSAIESKQNARVSHASPTSHYCVVVSKAF